MKRTGDTATAAAKVQRTNPEQPSAAPLAPAFSFFPELASSYHASNTLQESLVKMSRDITQESKKVGLLRFPHRRASPAPRLFNELSNPNPPLLMPSTAQVGFLLQRATPSNRSQILRDAEAALAKVRALVKQQVRNACLSVGACVRSNHCVTCDWRVQFAAIPPRDVLRYNKTIGWSHQEFIEAWALWRYLQGAQAPLLRDFHEWLNDGDGQNTTAADAASTHAAVPLSNPASHVPMYANP